MEGLPKNENREKVISPEDFFERKIEIHEVSKEEFLDFMKLMHPSDSEEDILQQKGNNFNLDGDAYIFLRKDIFPKEYMPYLATHEKWEAYIARKNGFNLWERSIREYKKDKGIENFTEDDKQQFYKNLNIYNYEFRHEYAIYKEYQEAMKDDKLDEYHKWIMNLKEKEKIEANDKNLKLIENDTQIRISIYKKLTENSKHNFFKK